MDDQLRQVELQFVSGSELQGDDKAFIEPDRIYMNLVWLSAELGSGAGGVAGGLGYRPTDAETQALGDIERDLLPARAAFEKSMGADLTAFNQRMQGKVEPIASTPQAAGGQ